MNEMSEDVFFETAASRKLVDLIERGANLGDEENG